MSKENAISRRLVCMDVCSFDQKQVLLHADRQKEAIGKQESDSSCHSYSLYYS